MTCVQKSENVPIPLKWVGGKRNSLHELGPRLPDDFDRRRYVEPFVGGGALFFALQPRKAVIADANPDLINVYVQLRDALPEVCKDLATLEERHNKYIDKGIHAAATYTSARVLFNSRAEAGTPLQAALFIYLNKTCFNGVWRVNKKGEFNVPMGRNNTGQARTRIYESEILSAASEALRKTDIVEDEFQETLDGCGYGDFVYLDPPYIPKSKTSNFTAYAVGGFTMAHQRILADCLDALHEKGARFMLSQADTPEARELYGAWNVEEISAKRSVAAKASSRKPAGELIVRNYN